jgi:DNA-binding LacI/PurR family transcriptional regulator
VAARHSAEDVRPQLTAADVPTLEMGTSAVDLLLERIAAPGRPRPSPAPDRADLAARQHGPAPIR